MINGAEFLQGRLQGRFFPVVIVVNGQDLQRPPGLGAEGGKALPAGGAEGFLIGNAQAPGGKKPFIMKTFRFQAPVVAPYPETLSISLQRIHGEGLLDGVPELG